MSQTSTLETEYYNFLYTSKQYVRSNFTIKQTQYHANLTDFEMIKMLGGGAFGTVILVRHVNTRRIYAMKAMKKARIVKTKQINNILTEMRVLQVCRHPNMVRLTHFCQDEGRIYFVMPFVAGGDMFGMMRLVRYLSEEDAKFYLAQVFMALEYLHYIELVYRDLKPENILIDKVGYIQLSDFGFCKMLTKGRTYTICGTPEYISPEIISMQGYGFTCDWWSFGVLIYELTTGTVPFENFGDHVSLYDKILKGKFKMPREYSTALYNLVYNLLQVDTTKRLGCMRRGIKDIKDHQWFKSVKWMQIFHRLIKPPIKPPPVQMPQDDARYKLSACGKVDFPDNFVDF